MKTLLTALLILSALVNFFFINLVTIDCDACKQKDKQIEFYYKELSRINSDTTHKWCIKLK